MQADNVNELLRFVVTHAVHKGNASSFFTMLKGVRLQKLGSGQLVAFGAVDPIFWSLHGLLPHSLDKVIDDAQKEILMDADEDRLRCIKAGKTVALHPLDLTDLLQHFDVLHEEVLTQKPDRRNRGWRERFWQLAWEAYKKGRHDILDSFARWRLVHVYSAGGGEALIELKDISSAFLMKCVDADWQQTIYEIVQRAGFHVLAPSHVADGNQLELLQSRAPVGDCDLCKLLAKSPNRLKGLHATDIMKLLEYFASRKEHDAEVLKELKAMPLFLLARPSSSTKYTSLDGKDNAYIAIRQDQVDGGVLADHVGNLVRLAIPGVVHLAWPSAKVDQLYRKLGVRLIASSVFVKEFVCSHLPQAAQQQDYAGAMEPLLTELASWVVPPPRHQKWEKACSDDMIKQIVEAAGGRRFVRAQNGAFVKPSETVRPDRQVAQVFENELLAWLPDEILRPHLPLLLQLHMKQRLPPNCILHCAKALDAVAGSEQLDDATVERSYFLVEDLSHALLSQNDGHSLLIQAARLRVVLARRGTPQTIGSYARVLAHACSAEGKERPVLPESVQLVSFGGGLALTGDHLVWSQLYCLARDKWPVEKRERQIEIVVRDDDAVKELGCSPASPGIIQKHLLTVAKSLSDQDGLPLYTFLDDDLEDIFSELMKHKVDSNTQTATALMETRCVPFRTETDASGKLDRGDRVLRLLLPTELFFEFGNPHSALGQYLNRCPPNLYNHMQGDNQTFLRSIGVQDEPDIATWLRCLRKIWNEAKTIPNGRLLPNQKAAAELCVLKCAQALGGRLDHIAELEDTFLFSEEGQLLRADQLIWADLPRWKRRCRSYLHRAELFFLLEQEDEVVRVLPKLCKCTKLRQLSQCVKEELSEATVMTEPDANDRKLLILLQSTEFAQACIACAKGADSDVAAMRKVLSELEISWSSAPLECVLRWVDTDEGSIVAGSSVHSGVFLDPSDGKIWMQSGLLGGDEPGDKRELLLDWAETVLPRLLQKGGIMGADASAGRTFYLRLLQCWEVGPSVIVKACERLDITFQAHLTPNEWESGSLVPLELHECVQQSWSYSYQAQEIIAVLDEEKSDFERYRYAKVLEASNPEASSTEQSNSRAYRVNTGQRVEHLPHFKLYKIESRKQKVEVRMVERECGAGDHETDGNSSYQDQLRELVSQLRQMEKCEPADYKQMCHRLYRQWHPDKTNHPEAAKFFRIIRRHCESFMGDKNYGWLDSVVDGGDDAQVSDDEAASMSQPYETGAGARTWFDEFKKEEEREQNAVHEAQSRTTPASRVPSAGGGADTSGSSAGRMLKPEEANLCWLQSAHALRSANVLLEAKIPADSVWHAQQAAEFAIKSLMMRTCGITNTEQKGPASHDLVKLVSRLMKGGQEWPVPREQLQFMSDGEWLSGSGH
eukprot:g2061.t1